MDLSPDLIDVATRAIGDSTGRVSFSVGDIAHLPTSRYAAILCRGVLNDIIDDAGRDAVFAAFAEALHSNGALILDVREWVASVERKTREPLFRKRVSTDRGELTFTSVTTLDPENRQLLISERHELIEQGEARVSDYHFVMRCWERGRARWAARAPRLRQALVLRRIRPRRCDRRHRPTCGGGAAGRRGSLTTACSRRRPAR